MAVLYWKLALACGGVYVLGRLIGSRQKWVEAGARASLAAAAVFALLLLVSEGVRQALYGAVLLAIVTWRHRDNLRRIAGAARG
jgi:glycerol-3-phosphate acyltransferase PlsY